MSISSISISIYIYIYNFSLSMYVSANIIARTNGHKQERLKRDVSLESSFKNSP